MIFTLINFFAIIVKLKIAKTHLSGNPTSDDESGTALCAIKLTIPLFGSCFKDYSSLLRR